MCVWSHIEFRSIHSGILLSLEAWIRSRRSSTILAVLFWTVVKVPSPGDMPEIYWGRDCEGRSAHTLQSNGIPSSMPGESFQASKQMWGFSLLCGFPPEVDPHRRWIPTRWCPSPAQIWTGVLRKFQTENSQAENNDENKTLLTLRASCIHQLLPQYCRLAKHSKVRDLKQQLFLLIHVPGGWVGAGYSKPGIVPFGGRVRLCHPCLLALGSRLARACSCRDDWSGSQPLQHIISCCWLNVCYHLFGQSKACGWAQTKKAKKHPMPLGGGGLLFTFSWNEIYLV